MTLCTEQITASDAAVYRLFIHDLKVLASIGVHPQERVNRQYVLISVELDVCDNPAQRRDDIADVLSYETIVHRVTELSQKEHINLVETLAERIAALCLEEARVEVVRVRVEKPDIFSNVKGVGVTLVRRRPSATKT